MELITREQFAERFNRRGSGLGSEDSPLWIGDPPGGSRCQYFLRLARPASIARTRWHRQTFLSWCEQHLKGHARCFSSGEDEEWWGFTEYDDILLWTLKWC